MANTARLVIDPIARKISTKYEKIRLVQNDNNSTRVTFEMPRYVRGHDMSNCSTVEVHYDNISIDRKQVNSDVYFVSDIIVAPEDEETINFSWLVDRNATQVVGTVEFSLHFGCDEDPSLEYAWHTTTYSGIVVLAGKHNTESVVDRAPSVFESFKNLVNERISEATAIIAEVKEIVDNINDQIYGDGDLPEDAQSGSLAYRVSELENEKADKSSVSNALKGSASGTTVVLTDVSPITHNMKVSVENAEDLSAVKVLKLGKNLFKDISPQFSAGVSLSKEDGYYILHGTPSSKVTFKSSVVYLPQGTYTLSAKNSENTGSGEQLVSVYSVNADGTALNGSVLWINNTTNYANKSKGLSAGYYVMRVQVITTDGTFDNFKFQPQLEFGSVETEYEPYNPTAYAVNADGTVDGVQSVYPSMVLTTDTEGAIVNCEYNRDIASVERKFDGKVDAMTPPTRHNYAYTVDANGENKLNKLSQHGVAGDIVKYDKPTVAAANGMVVTGTFGVAVPVEPYQAANKKYVDDTNNGIKLVLSMDEEFKLTASLLNKDGETLGETQEIDLPLEEMIVSGEVSEDGEKIILTLRNGETLEFSVSTLVDGFATKEEVEGKLDRIHHIGNVIYAQQNGTQRLLGYALLNVVNSVPLYGKAGDGNTDYGGFLQTSTPVNPYNCANKKYVDDSIAPIASELGKFLKVVEVSAETSMGYKVPEGALPSAYLESKGFTFWNADQSCESTVATKLIFYNEIGYQLGEISLEDVTLPMFFTMPSGTKSVAFNIDEIADSIEGWFDWDVTACFYDGVCIFQVKGSV